MKVEQHLRATLREMAGRARGVDELARTAMRQGARMRRRRRIAAVSGAAAALLLVALVPIIGKPAPPPSPGEAVVPNPGARLSEVEPRRLTGGWVIAGIHDRVLDRAGNT